MAEFLDWLLQKRGNYKIPGDTMPDDAVLAGQPLPDYTPASGMTMREKLPYQLMGVGGAVGNLGMSGYKPNVGLLQQAEGTPEERRKRKAGGLLDAVLRAKQGNDTTGIAASGSPAARAGGSLTRPTLGGDSAGSPQSMTDEMLLRALGMGL